MMNNKKLHYPVLLLLLALFLQQPLFAQNPAPENFVEKIKMGAATMSIELKDSCPYILQIRGPKDFSFKKELKDIEKLVLKSSGIDDEHFIDGAYTLNISPLFELPKAEQEALRALNEADQKAALDAKKKALQLPEHIEKFTRYFSISDGKFVLPQQENVGLRLPTDNSSPISSLSKLKLSTEGTQPAFTNLFNTPRPTFVDIVHNDDVILGPSLCVGADCVNGENFGSDTQKFKENALRILFDDTSSSGGGFPLNDWRVIINGSFPGAGDYFGIEDATRERIIFRLDAGAPTNSLYLNDDGNLGLGTNDPVVAIHILNGNSPTLRLDQDGSSGFTSQTWDIGGHESEFFIRDVTNASVKPFRIEPGAPTNTFYISNEGKVGIGFSSTPTVEQELHVDGNVAISGSILPVSDVRLKKDIKTIKNGLETIQQLHPTTYHFRTEQFDDMTLPTELQYGFIAQELEQILPELVTNSNNPDKNKNFKRVNYTALIPFLVKGMQEQQEEIEVLKEQLVVLKKLLEDK